MSTQLSHYKCETCGNFTAYGQTGQPQRFCDKVCYSKFYNAGLVKEPKSNILTNYDLTKLIITDQNLIDKYMLQFKEFFIPNIEDGTYDVQNLAEQVYIKSSEKIGQHLPIEVAIWEDDPYKDSSDFYRVHLRIIDGRHRWLQSIKKGKTWTTTFYNISNYSQFMLLRGHFDSKKERNPLEHERFFEQLAKYYHEILKIPREFVCSRIIADYSPVPFNSATIRRYMKNEYKNSLMRNRGKISLPSRQIGTIKEIQEKRPEQIRTNFSQIKNKLDKLKIEHEEVLKDRDRLKMSKPEYALHFDIMKVIKNRGIEGSNVTTICIGTGFSYPLVEEKLAKLVKIRLINKIQPNYKSSRSVAKYFLTENGKKLFNQIDHLYTILKNYGIKFDK